MERGLFACSPVSPTLAVDLRVLELVKKLFVRLTPNMTAWCEALENFLEAQGYKFQLKVSFCYMFDMSIFVVHSIMVNQMCSLFTASRPLCLSMVIFL